VAAGGRQSPIVIAGTILVAAALLYTLYELRHALLLFYVAIVLAVMFDPAVLLVERARLGRWHPGHGLSVAAVCLAVVVVVGLVLLVIVPPILSDASRLETQWPQQSAQALTWIHQHLPFTSSITGDTLTSWLQSYTGGRPVETVGARLVNVLTTLLLGVYLLADGRHAFAWALSLMPARHRDKARAAFTSGAHRMQRWVRGQGLLMLLHGGSAFITFSLIGLPYGAALATFAGLINVIPFLGPILTLLAAGLVAATEAPSKLLGVVIFYLAYHNTEGAWLQPRIMSSAVGVPGLAVIAALVVGDEVAGITGMVFSVPTAVLIAELANFYVADNGATSRASEA
jgi:predicted PurR-regulated permease PerM